MEKTYFPWGIFCYSAVGHGLNKLKTLSCNLSVFILKLGKEFRNWQLATFFSQTPDAMSWAIPSFIHPSINSPSWCWKRNESIWILQAEICPNQQFVIQELKMAWWSTGETNSGGTFQGPFQGEGKPLYNIHPRLSRRRENIEHPPKKTVRKLSRIRRRALYIAETKIDLLQEAGVERRIM